jgi:hypothetical protein
MKFAEPERRWHQFSLRSLLLFSTLVAILCSIGVSAHWSVSANLAVSLLIGAVSGGMVCGTRAGVIAGAVYGIPGFVLTIIAVTIVMLPASALWSNEAWAIAIRIALPIGGIIGGVAGGIAARGR